MAEQSKGVTRRDVLRGGVKLTFGGAALAGAYATGVYNGKDERREPSQEEVDAMYRKVYDYLQAEATKAKGYNKPMVILLGDSEPNEGRNALIMQLIAVEVAADLGIKVLGAAIDSERLMKLDRDKQGELVDMPNVKPAMQYAAKRRMSIRPIDLHIEKAFKNNDQRPDPAKVMNERNAEMVKQLMDIQGGAVAVVPDLHLRGLIESELSDKCHVAALSTLSMDKHKRLLMTSGAGDLAGGGEARRNLNFVIESDRVRKVELPSRMPDWRVGEVADKVQRAREFHQRERGIVVGAVRS